MNESPSHLPQPLVPLAQRLRLERLAASGWKCEACGDTETMLHVHHKRYVKGRLAWEYPASNFSVLCAPCHSEAHEHHDEMLAMLALLHHRQLPVAAALLAGFFGGAVDDLEACAAVGSRSSFDANLGHAASWMKRAGLAELEVALFAEHLSDPQFLVELRVSIDVATKRALDGVDDNPGGPR
jgi:hypothetical protein